MRRGNTHSAASANTFRHNGGDTPSGFLTLPHETGLAGTPFIARGAGKARRFGCSSRCAMSYSYFYPKNLKKMRANLGSLPGRYEQQVA